MESKICTQSNLEKHNKNFYKKYSECKDCNIKRGVNDTMVIKINYHCNKNVL